MQEYDLHFMRLALREARKGLGRTSPNPAVGAVVVTAGRVVGRGYHRKAGTAHAEVNALNAAGPLAANGTIYVTLEPCNHTGRTGPCTRAILESGIRRVVVGMDDPNPRVAGGGCDFLLSRGVEVSRGVLVEECRAINRPFIKHSTTGYPWVIMKGGISLDGRIASAPGHSTWITNERSRQHGHRLRDQVDAILVGVRTAITDDPSLTARLPRRRGRDPLRVILDTHLRLSPGARMLHQDSAAATWIFCGLKPPAHKVEALEQVGAVVRPVEVGKDGRVSLPSVLAMLGRHNITSLLVEGGGETHASFLRAGLVDQVCLFIAPVFFGAAGVPLVAPLGEAAAQSLRLQAVQSRRFGDDIMIEGRF